MNTSFIQVPKGNFLMGTNNQQGFINDKEGPAVNIHVNDFLISPYPVTNRDFLEFFKATAYITEAERFGSSAVFSGLLTSEQQKTYPVLPEITWWHEVPEANWRMPEGPDSSIDERMDHPVVHVSRNDALAYCEWAKVRLPTEAEWEYAARNKGKIQTTFPWGMELTKGHQHYANVWQGDFPTNNAMTDGYLGTAPVKTYQPNPLGLYQMIGNVWEWCLNPGQIPLSYFKEFNSQQFIHHYSQPDSGFYATRGGSFLCHDSYCRRYRLASRNQAQANSSSSNLGFRVVSDN